MYHRIRTGKAKAPAQPQSHAGAILRIRTGERCLPEPVALLDDDIGHTNADHHKAARNEECPVHLSKAEVLRGEQILARRVRAQGVIFERVQELLDKAADVVLMNGFEDDFVPQGSAFTGKRKRARALMLNVANKLLGTHMDDDTLIIGTSGRYEFKNKGIDVFLESLNRLNRDKDLQKNVLAFVNVPGWVGEPREDLQTRLKSKEKFDTPLEVPFITHWLHNMTHDQVLDMLKYLGMGNRPEDKVKVIFVPCYLDGKDGILNKEYYDLILGEDLSVYPSYYEPWGYTPLESVAFRVPTITTDLAGFGLWVNSLKNQHGIDPRFIRRPSEDRLP